MGKLWAWYPPVGVYIAILGLLAVLVPLFRDLAKISKREKAVWTSIMFLLVLLEIKSIYQDRNAHDKEQTEAREEQLREFKETSATLNTAIDRLQTAITLSDEHFDKTMERTDALVRSSARLAKMSKENIAEVTGGDSYAVVVPILYPLGGKPEFRLSASVQGKHPLRDVEISIAEQPEKPPFGSQESMENMLEGKTTNTIFKGSLLPKQGRLLSATVKPSETGTTEYIVNVDTRNISTVESLKIRLNPSRGWEYLCEVKTPVTESKPGQNSKMKTLISWPWTTWRVFINSSTPKY